MPEMYVENENGSSKQRIIWMPYRIKSSKRTHTPPPKENETDRICLVGIVTCHSHILAAPFYSKCVSILSHDSIELFDVYQQAIAATYMIEIAIC